LFYSLPSINSSRSNSPLNSCTREVTAMQNLNSL
jgi:hypothetical protein